MKTLLIITHTPSPNTQELADAVVRGAKHKAIENVQVVHQTPLATQPEDVLQADAVLIGTTENLGYMAGLIKDFFDRCYYPVLDKKQGLPFGLYIRAGYDGTGTCRAIESITTGLRWRWVQPVIICKGDWQEKFLSQVEELGMYMAAGLDNDIF